MFTLLISVVIYSLLFIEKRIIFEYVLMIFVKAGAAAVAAAAKQRRHLGQVREHPYQRAGALS